MSEEKDRDIERLLKNIPPPSPPPGLRGRILAGTVRRRGERRLLSPPLRFCFIVSIIVLIIALAGDALISRWEAVRASAIFSSAPSAKLDSENSTLMSEFYETMPEVKKYLEMKIRQERETQKRRLSRQTDWEEIARLEEEIDGLKN